MAENAHVDKAPKRTGPLSRLIVMVGAVVGVLLAAIFGIERAPDDYDSRYDSAAPSK